MPATRTRSKPIARAAEPPDPLPDPLNGDTEPAPTATGAGPEPTAPPWVADEQPARKPRADRGKPRGKVAGKEDLTPTIEATFGAVTLVLRMLGRPQGAELWAQDAPMNARNLNLWAQSSDAVYRSVAALAKAGPGSVFVGGLASTTMKVAQADPKPQAPGEVSDAVNLPEPPNRGNGDSAADVPQGPWGARPHAGTGVHQPTGEAPQDPVDTVR